VYEIDNDQPEEFSVIKLANAIIQPFTMMIEFGNAFVAGAAVFGFGANV